MLYSPRYGIYFKRELSEQNVISILTIFLNVKHFFSFFLLAIVLSVFSFPTDDYPFGIFKLILCLFHTLVVFMYTQRWEVIVDITIIPVQIKSWGGSINQLNPTTFLCLSQGWTWIYNIICHGLFCVQWVKMRGDCSFCWYCWNC